MTISEPERWLDDHGSALYSFALLHLRDTHRAEDLVQETLLAALKASKNFNEDSSVRTWLIGILKHKIMDQFRRQTREGPASSSADDAFEALEKQQVENLFTDAGSWNIPITEWGNPEQDLFRNEFWKFIERCTAGLSPKMARLFILRDLWGLETEEVCKELDITPTNLWTTLHRARLGMRQCLEKNMHL
jgi:RNA polymerase sigma-70 factor (ECF subfamily)